MPETNSVVAIYETHSQAEEAVTSRDLSPAGVRLSSGWSLRLVTAFPLNRMLSERSSPSRVRSAAPLARP